MPAALSAQLNSKQPGSSDPGFAVSKWLCRYGQWWMVQVVWDGWLSFGIHLDFLHRRDTWGRTFGPYVDLHLGIMILSLGWHPYLSTDLQRVISVSRGGPPVDEMGALY